LRSATVLRGLLVAWLSLAIFPAAASASGGASILRAMNSVRARHHLRALDASHALDLAASGWSFDMARSGVLAHGAFEQRIRHYVRSRVIGENLAMASGCDGQTIVNLWLNSAPHRHILLMRSFSRAGVGIGYGSGYCYVTADFAGAG
jgi:uncharacterized protein YkwD